MKYFLTLLLFCMSTGLQAAQPAQLPSYQTITEQLRKTTKKIKINRGFSPMLKEAIDSHDVHELQRLFNGIIREYDESIVDIPDVNAPLGSSKESPLMYAIGREAPSSLLKLLIEAGSNINATDNYGNTALFSAIFFNDADAAKLLINAGININHQNRGIRINRQNSGRTTALIEAVQHGNADITKQLLDAGADINIKDSQDKTAVDYAHEGGQFTLEHVIQGKFEIQKILEQYKKDVAEKVDTHLPLVLSQMVSEYVCE
jgi:ankyrin repeat protein